MNAPAPATVPQGLWRDIEVAPLGELPAEARVSVLLDGDPAAAAPTVAALASQTYPSELVEVVEPGQQAAPEGDIVIAIGAGAVPVPEFVEAHARWHHAVGDAVSLGPVAPDDAGADETLSLVRDLTRDLTDLGGGLHLAAAGGSLAVRRELYDAAQGAGEAAPELRRLDLLYRLHLAGCVFVAEPDALAHGMADDLARAAARACEQGATLEVSHPGAAAIVALPPFRATASPRRHARPAVVVNLPVADDIPADDAIATAREALAGRLGDLELRIQVADAHAGRSAIAESIAGDSRANLGPSSLGEPCQSPLQITLPVVAALDSRTLGDLHELALGEEAGALHVTVPGAAPQDAMIEVVATAAWRRAQRVSAATGEEPEQIIGRLFGERWVSGVEVSTLMRGVEEPQVTEHGPLAAATDLSHERKAHLRFRERADDLAERAAVQEQRTLAERLHARAERLAAERTESRLE